MLNSYRPTAVKISPDGDNLITSGAHYLHMSKKDLVEAAVAFYLDARREEMQAGMRELLSELDGSRASRVAMLAGMTRAELDSVGGAGDGTRIAPGAPLTRLLLLPGRTAPSRSE